MVIWNILGVLFVWPETIEPIHPRRITAGEKTNTGNMFSRYSVIPDNQKNSLEIQKENNKPTLLCDSKVLTRMDPRRAGTNSKAEAYPRPITFTDAKFMANQMIRTKKMCTSKITEQRRERKRYTLSTTPSTQPSRVV